MPLSVKEDECGAVWYCLQTDDEAKYNAAVAAADVNGKILAHLEWTLAPDAYHRNTIYHYRNFNLWALFDNTAAYGAFVQAQLKEAP